MSSICPSIPTRPIHPTRPHSPHSLSCWGWLWGSCLGRWKKGKWSLYSSSSCPTGSSQAAGSFCPRSQVLLSRLLRTGLLLPGCGNRSAPTLGARVVMAQGPTTTVVGMLRPDPLILSVPIHQMGMMLLTSQELRRESGGIITPAKHLCTVGTWCTCTSPLCLLGSPHDSWGCGKEEEGETRRSGAAVVTQGLPGNTHPTSQGPPSLDSILRPVLSFCQRKQSLG